jgi:predicted kinase
MKKLILITGDLACGKSTFARILSERYGSAVFYKDKIKEILGDTIGFSNREENVRLSTATMEIMTEIFVVTGKTGSDLILEANFKESEMRSIHRVAESYGYRVLTLALEADMEIIYKRFMNRIENENRHPVHVCGFDGYESLKCYILRGREQKCFGKIIKIDANDFSYQSNFSEIDAFMHSSEN